MLRKLLLTIAIAWLATGCGLLPVFPEPGDGAPDDGDGGSGLPQTPAWQTAAHFAPVLDLSWSPDAARVAVFALHDPLSIVQAADGTAFDWRADSTWYPPGCAFSGGVSWSKDGSRIALPGVVLDTETWSPDASLALDEGHMSDAIAFSPDGTRIAGGSRPRAGGQAGCICLVVWDPDSGEQVLALDAPGRDGYRAYISGVAWSPDGRRVLTHAWRGPTGVFDLATAELALELPGAASAAWSPDGTRIVLAHVHDPWVTEDAPGVVSVFDAASGALLLERTVLDVPVRAVAWHPAGDRIAVGATDGTVALLAADTLATVERTSVLGTVSVVRFGPDGVSLAAGTSAGVVHLLPASLAEAGIRAPVGRGEVIVTRSSPDDRYLASGGTDGVVAVRRASDGAVVAELATPHEVRDLARRPDGAWLAFAAADVIVVETETWERVAWPAAVDGIAWPEALAFGPNGASLAVMTNWDVHLIDVATMQAVWHFSPYEATDEFVALRRLSWSPTGGELVLAAEAGELWFVDPAPAGATGYRRATTAFAEVDALAHGGDGSLLVLAGTSATGDELRVAVLETATLDVRHDVTFASGGGIAAAAGFTQEDDWFWAAGTPYGCGCPGTVPGEGDVVKAWRVADGERVFGLANPRHAGAAAFGPDGARVVVGSLTGELSLLAVP